MAVSTAADGTPIDDWIEIHADGRVTVKTGKVELGTGLMTALAQIAAEELDVAVENVDVVGPWTGRSPDEGYTAGSRSIKPGRRSDPPRRGRGPPGVAGAGRGTAGRRVEHHRRRGHRARRQPDLR